MQSPVPDQRKTIFQLYNRASCVLHSILTCSIQRHEEATTLRLLNKSEKGIHQEERRGNHVTVNPPNTRNTVLQVLQGNKSVLNLKARTDWDSNFIYILIGFHD